MIRCLLLSALVGSFASAAAASTSAWSLREYVQTMWTHRNGLPLAPLGDFTQTTDGYLWFLSERGGALTRFDGVQFTTFSMPCNVMHSLRADGSGGLWILCRDAEYKLFRRQTGRPIVEVALGGIVARGQPALLWTDSRDRLWILGDVIARHQPDGSFRTFGRLPLLNRTVAEDATGAVWVSDGHNALRIHNDIAESLVVGGNVFGTPQSGVHASDLSSISRLGGQSFTTVARASGGLTFGHQSVIDSSGAVWTITPQYGIARIENGRIETLLSPGDVGSSVSEVFIDREDNVWVATAAGLHRFRKPHARLLHALGGQVPAKPLMVWVDPQNDLWVGNEQGVSHTSTSTNVTTHLSAALPSALAQDRHGRVWLGTRDQLYRVESGKLRAVADAAGAAMPRVRQMVADVNGELWAVAQGIGVYQLTPGPPRLVFDLPRAEADIVISSTLGTWVALGGRDGITQIPRGGAAITHRFADSDSASIMRIAERGDAIWVGHMRGLSRWRNGRWTTWSRAHGLPGRGAVQEIISDHLGRVWLLSDLGILGVSAAELDATPDGAPSALRFLRIGELDRVVPHPGNLLASPRASRDRDGRLYFATVDSIVVVDPAAVTESKVRPTILLESMSADGAIVDQSARAELTMPSKLEFDYTSLSLRSPETIRFRYRLEGHDKDWVEAGGTRRASYGTLPPGTYRFHVIGSGSEGIWNEEGASYAFTIVPLFYNTWWFRGTAVLLLIAVFAGGHRLRVRSLTRQMQREFDARLAERTRIAQELHDTLLQGTLAASLHAQLADQAAEKAPDSPAIDAIRTPVKQVVELLARVARDSRAVLNGLRATPADADIAQALHRAAAEQPNSSEIDFRLSVLGDARTLQPAVVEHVIRIAGEAVANAYQHAKAQRVTADLIYTEHSFQCIVRDDGRGMNATLLEHGRHGHWGLTGMRERAERAGGQLHLRSSPTAGTEVELSLPASLAYS